MKFKGTDIEVENQFDEDRFLSNLKKDYKKELRDAEIRRDWRNPYNSMFLSLIMATIVGALIWVGCVVIGVKYGAAWIIDGHLNTPLQLTKSCIAAVFLSVLFMSFIKIVFSETASQYDPTYRLYHSFKIKRNSNPETDSLTELRSVFNYSSDSKLDESLLYGDACYRILSDKIDSVSVKKKGITIRFDEDDVYLPENCVSVEKKSALDDFKVTIVPEVDKVTFKLPYRKKDRKLRKFAENRNDLTVISNPHSTSYNDRYMAFNMSPDKLPTWAYKGTYEEYGREIDAYRNFIGFGRSTKSATADLVKKLEHTKKVAELKQLVVDESEKVPQSCFYCDYRERVSPEEFRCTYSNELIEDTFKTINTRSEKCKHYTAEENVELVRPKDTENEVVCNGVVELESI